MRITQESIIFERVTHIYPGRNEPALENVDLVIPEKGVYGLLGPNGAGKTTLLRLAAALMEPTQGRVLVKGHDTRKDGHRIRRLIGYLPQEYDLFPMLTGREFLEYMALLEGLPQREKRINDLLAWIGLEKVAHRPIRTYSGGMKQRLALAQAVLSQPPILLLDEPTTGLDPEERLRFKDWLLDYAQNHTVVLSSHLVEDIALLSDRIAILRQGQLRCQGRLVELVKKVEGRVWIVILPWKQRDILQKIEHLIPISTRVLEDGSGQLEVRFLWMASGTPPIPHAQLAKPTLQDIYKFIQIGE